MEDMQKLWEEGVQMMDASLEKEFTLKAIIFVTITDYPGIFSLSGQIKGKTSCIVCIDGTCYTYLSASKKMVYMRHRRFLPKKHWYRHPSINLYFDNQDEPQTNELERTVYRQKVFDLVKGINVKFRKKNKEEEDGPKKPRKKRKRDTAEEEAVSPCRTPKPMTTGE
jgi:hypothetical protein